jgi:tetratricopeptide (TPR) repeat protein
MGWLIWPMVIAQVLLTIGCAKDITLLNRYQAQRHYEYGLSHLYLQNTQAAYREFQRAKKLNPEEAKIYEGLGLVLLKQNDYQRALASFQRAVELNPGLASAYQHISDLYLKLEEWGKAMKYAGFALALPAFDRRHLAYYNQGVALFNLRKYAEARRALEQALELAPKWAEARLVLGKNLFAQGKTSLAIVEYRKALAQAQQNWYERDEQLLGYLHYQLGVAYIAKGYIKQGIEEFRQSLDIYPSSEAELALQKYAPQ